MYAHFRRTGKVGGNLLRDFARGRPFGPALQGRGEPDAGHGVGAVPHGGVENPAVAVFDRKDHRLLLTAPTLRRIGIGGGQHIDVFGRPAQQTVKLVFGVHPGGGMPAVIG